LFLALLGSVSLDKFEKVLANVRHSVVSGFLQRRSREVG
jgi:hypothetical protein